MKPITIWLIIFLSGVGTYFLRISLIYLYGKINLPSLLEKSLRFIPPAVFSALMVPQLFYIDNTLNISLNNYRLMAGIIAAFVAWKVKNVLLTTFVGLGALWLIQWAI
ncbi:MAG: AzlD domain-containing protein [Bacillota bacterium]